MLDYYTILELTPTATAEDLRLAFRRLAKLWHPDRIGGNARRFSAVREAYGVLSEPTRRKLFDRERLRTRTLHATAPRPAASPTAARGGRAYAPTRYPAPSAPKGSVVESSPAIVTGRRKTSSDQPSGRLTRVMSIAVPIEGAIYLVGVAGSLQVEPTTVATLWPTTLQKFGHDDLERLARHVVQIRVTGESEVVRGLFAQAAVEGVLLNAEEAARGARSPQGLRRWLEAMFSPLGHQGNTEWPPLTLQMTMPLGTTLVLDGFAGMAELGHLEGNLIANVSEGQLRAGRLKRAMVTMQGNSRLMLTAMTGATDIVGQGSSRSSLLGRVPRLRVALEGSSRLEVMGIVRRLEADLFDKTHLRVLHPLETARCRVKGESLAELSAVTRKPLVQESEKGRVRVGGFSPLGRQRSA